MFWRITLTSGVRSVGTMIEIADGNDMTQDAGCARKTSGSDTKRRLIVISHTIKGKQISFMERQLKWHAGSLNDADLETALHDLDESFAAQKEALQ